MNMTSLEELPPTISVVEAGEILGICERSAYRAVNAGDLPSIRIGRRVLVPTAELRRMLGIRDSESAEPLREPAP